MSTLMLAKSPPSAHLKAFDCVDRDKLLDKLGWYGIAKHWFSDYFSNRRQTVQGGSECLDVPVGVVQGSILGPLMFILFTSDLAPHLSEGTKIISYADDTQLLHSSSTDINSLTCLKTTVETDLIMLSKWFRHNGLKINPKKTDFTLLGTTSHTKRASTLSVVFEGEELKKSECIKILGVHIDQNIPWVTQTSHVVKRCFGTLLAINKLKDVLPKTTVKTLVQSLVFPHFLYCLPAWAPHTEKQRKRVEKVINFGTRIVTGKKRRDHITESRQQLGWLSFAETIQLRDSIKIHRLINRADGPLAVRAMVSARSDISSRSTRATNAGMIQTSSTRPPRLETTKKAFPYRAVNTWNLLPASAKNCPGSLTFKKHVRQFVTR